MGQNSDHFDGRKFHNINPRQHGFPDLLRWMLTRQRGKWPKWRESKPGPKPPERVPGAADSKDALRITFVNHTTFLIQSFGLNILTDPIWSKRSSPVQWIGPARVRAPGIRFEDLPPIDVVLLSHRRTRYSERTSAWHLISELSLSRMTEKMNHCYDLRKL
jgi:hypothetical protein